MQNGAKPRIAVSRDTVTCVMQCEALCRSDTVLHTASHTASRTASHSLHRPTATHTATHCNTHCNTLQHCASRHRHGVARHSTCDTVSRDTVKFDTVSPTPSLTPVMVSHDTVTVATVSRRHGVARHSTKSDSKKKSTYEGGNTPSHSRDTVTCHTVSPRDTVTYDTATHSQCAS